MSVQSDAVKAASRTFNGAQKWASVILIVGAFLTYLYMHDKFLQVQADRLEIVAIQRIESCHGVQDRSIDVMGRLMRTLEEQARAFEALTIAFMDLKETVRSKP